MEVNLNPDAGIPQRKRYYMVIKNCSECPFWNDCKTTSFLHDDFIFPGTCPLHRWVGDETEKALFYKNKG